MAWYWWFLAALALAGAELFHTQLVLLMLAAGALAGGLTSLTGAHFLVQVVVASLVSVLMIVTVRPVAYRHLKGAALGLRTGVDVVKGARGVVLAAVSDHDGRVKVNGEIWSARSYNPFDTIDVGVDVTVVEIDGATAIVLPAELP